MILLNHWYSRHWKGLNDLLTFAESERIMTYKTFILDCTGVQWIMVPPSLHRRGEMGFFQCTVLGTNISSFKEALLSRWFFQLPQVGHVSPELVVRSDIFHVETWEMIPRSQAFFFGWVAWNHPLDLSQRGLEFGEKTWWTNCTLRLDWSSWLG